jgi:hypothetical protein
MVYEVTIVICDECMQLRDNVARESHFRFEPRKRLTLKPDTHFCDQCGKKLEIEQNS